MAVASSPKVGLTLNSAGNAFKVSLISDKGIVKEAVKIFADGIERHACSGYPRFIRDAYDISTPVDMLAWLEKIKQTNSSQNLGADEIIQWRDHHITFLHENIPNSVEHLSANGKTHACTIEKMIAFVKSKIRFFEFSTIQDICTHLNARNSAEPTYATDVTFWGTRIVMLEHYTCPPDQLI